MDTELLDPFELPPVGEEDVTRPGTQRGKRITVGKTAVLGIRMFPSERRAVNAAARRAGRRETSAWARETLLAAAAGEEVPCVDEAAHEELLRLRRDLNSGIGSNLNQAMHWANREAKMGRAPDRRVLLERVMEVEAGLEALRHDLARVIAPRGRR